MDRQINGQTDRQNYDSNSMKCMLTSTAAKDKLSKIIHKWYDKSGNISSGMDLQVCEMLSWSNARQHEQLCWADDPSRHNHLFTHLHRLWHTAVTRENHANCTRVFKYYLQRMSQMICTSFHNNFNKCVEQAVPSVYNQQTVIYSLMYSAMPTHPHPGVLSCANTSYVIIVSDWASSVWCPTGDIIGHFVNMSFWAIDCTCTDNNQEKNAKTITLIQKYTEPKLTGPSSSVSTAHNSVVMTVHSCDTQCTRKQFW